MLRRCVAAAAGARRAAAPSSPQHARRLFAVRIATNGAELTEWINEADPAQLLVINYTASWCGPCQRFAPILTSMAKARPDVDFIKIDVDAAQEQAASASITSVPTFHLVKHAAVLDVVIGADQQKLDAAIADNV